MFYMAVVLYAPALALNAVTGFSTWTSVVSLAIVCTFYSSLGGLKAVLWADLFQGMLMLIALVAIGIKGSMDVGGVQNVLDRANDGGRLIISEFTTDLTQRYTFWNSLVAGFMFNLQTFGTNQAQVQRMLSVGNLKKAQKALFCSVPLVIFFHVICLWDGIVIYANSYDCDPLLSSTLESADQLVPFSIVKMFSHLPGVAGLCIAGVFSAALSTISSALNSLTMVSVEDFIKPYCACKRLTDSRAVLVAKLLGVVYSGLCLLLVFFVSEFRGVIEAAIVLFSMVGGPVVGIYVLGMFTKTANQMGTNIGLITGFLFNAWMGFGTYATKPTIPKLPQTTVGCPAALNFTGIYEEMFNENNFTSTTITNTSLVEAEERYIFPLYQVSYLWSTLFGSIVVIIVGYFASFLIDFCKDERTYDPELFSPFVKNWFFKQKKVNKMQPHCELQIANQTDEKITTKL